MTKIFVFGHKKCGSARWGRPGK